VTESSSYSAHTLWLFDGVLPAMQEEDPAQAPQGSGPLLKFTMLPPLKKQLVDDWDRVARR